MDHHATEVVRKFIDEDPLGGWDKAWQTKTTPWDYGDVQPALRELVESKAVDLPTSGCALVPGCGRGYDAIYIASALGLSTAAVDISKTAVSAANELLSNSEVPTGGAQVKFVFGDFFTEELGIGGRTDFDLVYDYTFFVAIDPARRPEWGRRMSELVRKGGYLITLVFPIDPPRDYGPPFFVRPAHYDPVLAEHGWEKVYDKIPEKSAEAHVNRERMVVWKKL
ncbi:hypothetical protein EUX98_g404 [Antrodiella citrinella]|uniref:Methyltransferase domain-containing protein n=1 Tax=Antrodiella citrinella TaxID=2447956 RepID=A0A4S4NCQ5_9APHY|nr:hypothetical protein EUX98_g404 [Antrodiella citrinella]